MTHSTPTTSTPQDLTTGIVPELLTTKQAAALCNCGERTLWSWSRSGISPAPVKIGFGLRPAVRFRRQDLVEWVSRGCPRVDKGDNQR